MQVSKQSMMLDMRVSRSDEAEEMHQRISCGTPDTQSESGQGRIWRRSRESGRNRDVVSERQLSFTSAASSGSRASDTRSGAACMLPGCKTHSVPA